MNKSFLLPLFAVAVMVSQAWAERCQINGKPMNCQIGGGCYEYSTEYSGVGENDATCGPKNTARPTCTCDELIEGCQAFGQAWTDVPESVTAAPGYGSGQTCTGTLVGGATNCGTCLYADGGCHVIWSGGPESKGATCDVAMATCGTDGGTTGCTAGTTTPPTTTPPTTTPPTTTPPTTTPPTTTPPTTTPPTTTPPTQPIIKTIPGMVAGNALKAMQNAVNLQVKSDASFSIFDMKGNTLRTQKIGEGNHVVQLQLPRGLYIIKATSGSWSQTVKVTVK